MKNMKLRLFKTLVILLIFSWVLAVSVVSVFAAADAYPSRPVRLVVSSAPGGSPDIVGRMIASKLSQLLGERMIIENRPGGGGIIGTEMVARAAPDGYTLIVLQAKHAVQPAFEKLPYDLVKDFTPIAKVANGLNVLAAGKGVPANSVKELIALAKQKPGQLLGASSGVGTNTHLSLELFKKLAGIDFKRVQFKSSGPACVDIAGGHSDFIMTSILPVKPHLASGKMKVLAVLGAKRSALMPDVPTMAEAGVPGFEVSGWWGIGGPAGIPGPIADKLAKEIKKFLFSTEVQKLFSRNGMEVDYMDSAEFRTFIERDTKKWVDFCKEAKLGLFAK